MKRKQKPHRSRQAPSTREFNAILEAKALKSWSANIAGCLKFLTELKGLKEGKGDEWAKGNREYYLKRVRHLLDNVPKGASSVAAAARRLLAKLE